MMRLGKLAAIAFLGFLTGCTANQKIVERKVYVSVPLSLPARPELPRVRSDSLTCVDDETKWALLKRDVAIKNYISELETIIESTNKRN